MLNYNEALKLETLKTKEDYRAFDNRIVTEQARYPLKNAKSNFSDFILAPEYQRNNVWEPNKQSKLIESFMINIPIPPVFLYETSFSKYEVVDGRQRISAILSFYNNEFPLTGLEIFTELEGKRYEELEDEFKERLDRRFLSAIILLKESTSTDSRELELKQFIFERLNTGGELLEPQEIRSALYSDSEFNNLVKELKSNKLFTTLFKMSEKQCNRMLDQEMILRFFAYKSAHYLKLSLGTKEVLNKYMSVSRNFDHKVISELRELFIKTISFVSNNFGPNAFVRTGQEKSRKPEKLLYDSIMIASAVCIEKKISINLDQATLINKKNELLEKNKSKFNGRNTSLTNVRERVDLFLQLLGVKDEND